VSLLQSGVQKRRELYFVDEAISLLQVNWQVEICEAPDFIVTCGDEKFALEVTEIQSGANTRKGSKEKQAESANTKWLESIRVEFDPDSQLPLDLKYLGKASDKAKHSLLEALRAERFAQRPILHLLETKLYDGGKVWALNAIVHRWQFMTDLVGWVSQDPVFLQDVIAKKSSKIARYRATHSDVRLLVVADRRVNSGKILLDAGICADLCGFNAVYFLSCPTMACEIHSI
jgi:hypothetical protein